jgi:hypothetical protein
MSLRKSPRRTLAQVAANRRNAGKSTGPKTARGKETVSLNSLKHGLRSRSPQATIAKAGEPTEKFQRVAEILLHLLRPRNRTQAVRVARYARMLWAVNRRFQRYRLRRTKRASLMELSRAERAQHKLVEKDLQRVMEGASKRLQRQAEPIMGFVKVLNLMPDSPRPKGKNYQQSRNVV